MSYDWRLAEDAFYEAAISSSIGRARTIMSTMGVVAKEERMDPATRLKELEAEHLAAVTALTQWRAETERRYAQLVEELKAEDAKRCLAIERLVGAITFAKEMVGAAPEQPGEAPSVEVAGAAV